MPTADLRIRTESDSTTQLRPLHQTAFIAFDDVSDSRTWLKIGRVVSARASSESDSDTSLLAQQFAMGLSESESMTTLLLVERERVAALVEAGTESDSDTSLYLLLGVALPGLVSDSDSSTVLYWGDKVPDVDDPSGEQYPGTVNLVGNPALDLVLDGWSAGAGAALSRDDGDAWVRTHSALLEVEAGSGEVDVTVQTERGLNQGPARYWIGSWSAKSESLVETVSRLVVRYTDGTSDDFAVPLDTAVNAPEAGSWRRYSTEAVQGDPAKRVDSLDLVVTVFQGAGPAEVRLDGAQVEEARWGEATDYADGGLGEGHWWVGAPGLSMSVRDTA